MFGFSATKSTRIAENDTLATASILLSNRQEMPFLKDRESLQVGGETFTNQTCSYIEDYRSSTVIDIIGSIGGLFALLQTLHVVLFGRPMLWGLTGKSRVTPDGEIYTQPYIVIP